MLALEIPDFGTRNLEYLVLDYNGTLALDGELLPGVAERLSRLSKKLAIHVVTGDTFGKARQALGGILCELTILPGRAQSAAKRKYVKKLGVSATVCVGNGRNDRLMLEVAALAIAVVQTEGASPRTLEAADIVVTDVRHALDLLADPKRLEATLRG